MSEKDHSFFFEKEDKWQPYHYLRIKVESELATLGTGIVLELELQLG